MGDIGKLLEASITSVDVVANPALVKGLEASQSHGGCMLGRKRLIESMTSAQ